ncbi:MAG TPA: amino acid permease C-terminal domain-containing protein, partial [Gemmatimonadaceae bacterium]|nr:amino acid permease C-terminal domain-containing protein [Gemmatimonadaceae bacterium]
PIGVLTQLTAMGTLLAFVIVCVGVLLLRRRSPELERPFRTPGLPWVPIFGALLCLGQMAALPKSNWIRLIAWLVIGLAVYFGYGRKNAARVRAAAGVGGEEPRMALKTAS